MDTEGAELGMLAVTNVQTMTAFDRTMLVQVQAPREYARRIAGIRFQESQITEPMTHYVEHVSDDTIVCRCERVTAGEIRALVRQGYRDMNEIKVVTRAGMGACGAKTCNPLIHRIFREEGIPGKEIADHTRRPVFIEVPLGIFAGYPPDRGELQRGRQSMNPSLPHYDVIIIGAGSIGAPAAFYLAQAGLESPGDRQGPQRRPGFQQKGHRRHPRHPFRPCQGAPLPAQD